MGLTQSQPEPVNNTKLTSEQIHENIKQLFRVNEKKPEVFSDTIGWRDTEVLAQTGGNFASPKKRYEQFNIDNLAGGNRKTINVINMTSEAKSDVSMSELDLLKDIIKKQTGGCGCSDARMSATSSQPMQLKKLRGGGDDKKEDDKKEDDKKKKKHKKDDNSEEDDEDIEFDEDDENDEEDVEDLDDGESENNLERLMTHDGSSDSSSSSSTTSASDSSSDSHRKKKNAETSSQTGGEINVAPFYSSESRSENFKHMQKRNKWK